MEIYKENKHGELVSSKGTYPEWMRPKIEIEVIDGSSEIVPYDPAEDDARAVRSKIASDVQKIKVTVNNNEYNADDKSRNRMMAAAQTAELRGNNTIGRWKMADNSIVADIPIDDLKEAIALSWEATDSIWIPE